MGRTNPVGLRVKGLLNWPSNVRHPFLTSYIKHIFQQYLVGDPGIRASTTGIWINVTLLDTAEGTASQHPKVIKPILDFKARTHRYSDAILGRNEIRIKNLLHGVVDSSVASGKRYHHYYGQLAGYNVSNKDTEQPKTSVAESQFDALGGKEDLTKGLQIYKDTPIHLKINIIKSPTLDAGVLAQFVAKQMKRGESLQRIHKELLLKIGSSI